MKKLDVLQKGKRITFLELLTFEAKEYVADLKECTIIFNPSSILTYKIEGTNYFFRDNIEFFENYKNLCQGEE